MMCPCVRYVGMSDSESREGLFVLSGIHID